MNYEVKKTANSYAVQVCPLMPVAATTPRAGTARSLTGGRSATGRIL
jgi:hypothetical protein